MNSTLPDLNTLFQFAVFYSRQCYSENLVNVFKKEIRGNGHGFHMAVYVPHETFDAKQAFGWFIVK